MRNRQTHIYFVRTSELPVGDDATIIELRERVLEEDLASILV